MIVTLIFYVVFTLMEQLCIIVYIGGRYLRNLTHHLFKEYSVRLYTYSI